jgi:hypothetical protein
MLDIHSVTIEGSERMRSTRLRWRHLVGATALSSSFILGALSFSTLPVGAQAAPAMMAAACPQLSVANPNPGDNITEGGYVISGEAFDPSATSGAGVSNVELFLGARDQGGTFLGNAVPGSSGTNARAWSVEVTIPTNFNRQADFAAYAQSSVSGAETSVTFPVFVGTQPKPVGVFTPTPVPSGMTIANSGCSSTAAMAPAGAGAPAAAPAVMATPAAAMNGNTTTTTTAATGASSCPTLSLANPSPGNNLIAGDMFISGTATGAGGVSRVDLFLGERDQGGTYLGSGVPGTGSSSTAFNVKVTIPNLNRGVNFAAYAIGSNGQEQATVFPVFVGAQTTNGTGPTPTPIPQTETVTSTCG